MCLLTILISWTLFRVLAYIDNKYNIMPDYARTHNVWWLESRKRRKWIYFIIMLIPAINIFISFIWLLVVSIIAVVSKGGDRIEKLF